MPDTRPRFSWPLWLGWIIVAELAILILPTSLVYGHALWNAERVHVGAGLAAVQLLTALLIVGAVARGRDLDAFRVSALALTLLGIFYLSLLILRVSEYSRLVLLLGSFLVVTVSLIPVLRKRARWATLALLTAVVLAGAAVGTVGEVGIPEEIRRIGSVDDEVSTNHVRKTIPASYYTLRADHFEGVIPSTPATSGALDVVDDRLVVMTGDGELYIVELPFGSDSIASTPLGIAVPLNRQEFASATPSVVSTNWFGATDVLAERVGEKLRIVSSHHYWKTDQECFVLRVSEVETGIVEGGRSGPSSEWRTLYESEPCLQLKDWKRGHLFGGLQAGGRLARLGPERILLTVGDHEFDGWNSQDMLSQSETGDYGKTLLLERGSEARVFTLGHRNPQGLHISRDGKIWSTEHGPEGGDELNLLVHDGDYGWPYATMGTEYGMNRWPIADTTGEEFTRPIFGWIPSIGVSNLTSVRDTLFDRWRGDLLIASLRAHTLFRARIREGRVIVMEPVEIGERIRDIEEDHLGRIVLLLDTETVVFLSPADQADDGEAIFATQCAGCHETEAGASRAIGPNLDNVFMRRIGWRDDFEYSDPMDSLQSTPDGVWNEQNLDAFLKNPEDFAPGTTMQWEGLNDPEKRRALIDYLGTL